MAERQVEIAVDAAIVVARFAIDMCDTFMIVIHGDSTEFEVWSDVLVVVTKVLVHETHVIEA